MALNEVIGYYWDAADTYSGPIPVPTGYEDASHNPLPAPTGPSLLSEPQITANIPAPVPVEMTVDMSPLQPFPDYMVIWPDYDPTTGHVYGEWVATVPAHIAATQGDPSPLIYDPDDFHFWNSNQRIAASDLGMGHIGCAVVMAVSVQRANRTAADCMTQSIPKAAGMYDGANMFPNPSDVVASNALPPLQMPNGDYNRQPSADIVPQNGSWTIVVDKHFGGPLFTLPLSPDAALLQVDVKIQGFPALGFRDTSKVPIFSLPEQFQPPADWPYADPVVQSGQHMYAALPMSR